MSFFLRKRLRGRFTRPDFKLKLNKRVQSSYNPELTKGIKQKQKGNLRSSLNLTECIMKNTLVFKIS